MAVLGVFINDRRPSDIAAAAVAPARRMAYIVALSIAITQSNRPRMMMTEASCSTEEERRFDHARASRRVEWDPNPPSLVLVCRSDSGGPARTISAL